MGSGALGGPSPTKRLRSVVLPKIDEAEVRLRAARHKTLLDDRLDGSDGVLRFRLAPRRGPFDEEPVVAGSVLELQVEGDRIVARVWLDLLADEPTSESVTEADDLNSAWFEGILVDFVAKSLRSA